jgi:hypothetical protein
MSKRTTEEVLREEQQRTREAAERAAEVVARRRAEAERADAKVNAAIGELRAAETLYARAANALIAYLGEEASDA